MFGSEKLLGWALGIILVAAFATVGTTSNAYVTTLLFNGLIAYILAQSWDWVGGESGYVNLGHFGFYGIGAYAFAVPLSNGTPLVVCFVFAIILTMAVAALLSFPIFRLRGDYFAFATLALMPLLELLTSNLHEITKGADGVVLPAKYVLYEAYALAIGLAIIALLVSTQLPRWRLGYALKGIRNDEEASEVVGIRIFPAKMKVLVLSAAFAGLAGSIQAWQLSYIDPPSVFGLDIALIPIAMALLGGSGLLWGPIVGVILLSVVQTWLINNISMLQTAIYGTMILLIGRFMPGGLLRAGWVRRLPYIGRLGKEHHERVAPAGNGQIRAAGDTSLPLPEKTGDDARTLLDINGLTKAFGGNIAVNDLSLSIKQGEIVGLVGANGSGKTTLFNCISRVFEPTGGTIMFDGQSLAGKRRDEISRLGIGRTYQIPHPFSDLTVQENIAIPLMFRADDDALSLHDALATANDFMRYAGLAERAADRADALSLQEKKALEFARALACRPKLLLVDEVASGLTPAEVNSFVEHIREIRDRYGITIIWVEHIFSALSQVVDRVVVMEEGSIIADGPLEEVVKDERVLKTYLGSAGADAR